MWGHLSLQPGASQREGTTPENSSVAGEIGSGGRSGECQFCPAEVTRRTSSNQFVTRVRWSRAASESPVVLITAKRFPSGWRAKFRAIPRSVNCPSDHSRGLPARKGVSLDRIADHHDSVVAHPVKQFFSVRGPDRKPTPAGGNLPLPARAGRTLHTFPIRWSCRQSSAHHVHRTHRDSTKCGMTWKDLHPAENNLSGFIQALVLLVKPTHPTTFFLIHRHSLPYQVFRRVYPV